MKEQGVVRHVANNARWFFIASDLGGVDVFAHCSSTVDGRAPASGTRVTYELGVRNGKPIATAVKIVGTE
jgi:cold shock CspA family protein